MFAYNSAMRNSAQNGAPGLSFCDSERSRGTFGIIPTDRSRSSRDLGRVSPSDFGIDPKTIVYTIADDDDDYDSSGRGNQDSKCRFDALEGQVGS